MAEAQQAFDNLARVLADQRTGQVIERRGFREFERGILHLPHPQGRMLHLQIHLPVAQLRVVLHPVFGTLHGQGAYASGLAALRQLVLAQRHAPRFDALVHLLLVLQASGERGELRRGGPRRLAHHLHQPLPFLVRVADDHAPVVVVARMGAIGVVRRDRRPTVVVDQRRAGPVRAIAGGIAGAARPPPVHREVQQSRAVERNARHHLRLVDMLALPRHVAVVETR